MHFIISSQMCVYVIMYPSFASPMHAVRQDILTYFVFPSSYMGVIVYLCFPVRKRNHRGFRFVRELRPRPLLLQVVSPQPSDSDFLLGIYEMCYVTTDAICPRGRQEYTIQRYLMHTVSSSQMCVFMIMNPSFTGPMRAVRQGILIHIVFPSSHWGAHVCLPVRKHGKSI